MPQKECLAMLLAGGKGSRLEILTRRIAKPAIPFGGKYRIIDFTLSNCSNSGIDTIGVLTQYQPLVLNSYISSGAPWDLDRKSGGITLLPPFVREEGGEWYKGTANAVYQNIEFIDRYNPLYVLIISGDHIYKMDYSKMLSFHKKNNAEGTIAVIEVPWQEATRFGIMNTGEDGRIVEFEEKPQVPQNNLASMGVYIFNWGVLKKQLIKDENNSRSSNDFGKDVIPQMLKSGQKLFTYSFQGYWKDVGTVRSLWEANMDLLSPVPPLNLNDRDWKIYSADSEKYPQFIGATARINCSLISQGCLVLGEVEHSVLSTCVYVGEGTKIKDSVIMPNAHIGNNVQIETAIIGAGVRVGDNCQIRDSRDSAIALIEEDADLCREPSGSSMDKLATGCEEGEKHEKCHGGY